MQTKACLVHLTKSLKPFLSKKTLLAAIGYKIGSKMQKICMESTSITIQKISFELVLFISRALSVCILVSLCPSNLQ